MKNVRLVIVLAASILAVQPAGAQRYKTPRTPWGDPDLQGLWSNQTSTPLERPDALKDRETLTPQEADEREEEARASADRPPRAGDPGTYNAVWRDPGKGLTRTSLIVDPPDGRVPPLTPEGQARVAARAAAARTRQDAYPWEPYGAWTRCITRGVAPDAIDYQFTVDDPTIFTRSWTVSMPMTKGGSVFEYAPSRRNYAMGNMLAGTLRGESRGRETRKN